MVILLVAAIERELALSYIRASYLEDATKIILMAYSIGEPVKIG